MLNLVDLVDIEGEEHTVNPRHVVRLKARKGAQTPATIITLSIGDTLVVDAPPSQVKKILRGVDNPGFNRPTFHGSVPRD